MKKLLFGLNLIIILLWLMVGWFLYKDFLESYDSMNLSFIPLLCIFLLEEMIFEMQRDEYLKNLDLDVDDKLESRDIGCKYTTLLLSDNNSFDYYLILFMEKNIFKRLLYLPLLLLYLFGYSIKSLFVSKVFKKKYYFERDLKFLESGINIEYPKEYISYMNVKKYIYTKDRLFLIFYSHRPIYWLEIPLDSFVSKKDKKEVLEMLNKKVIGEKFNLFKYSLYLLKIGVLYYIILTWI